ncbi:hypothetical protein B0H17DRAFT_1009257 [Mycena rosella]|uniref:Uncharacterized protein n=1 Tax=Mycena rosella TaxID=1033263 RepID=A0AAD7GGX0_MYCRO|nr:hypothetical protein B0H17DRAFT_1009257 [Mycena rosella]
MRRLWMITLWWSCQIRRWMSCSSSGPYSTRHSSKPIQLVVGVLRLSTKYEVSHLLRRALVHLSSASPTTLPDWEILQHHVADSPEWKRLSWSCNTIITRFSFIRLCREVGALSNLPAACYRLGSSGFDPAVILQGFNDGISLVQLDVSDRLSFFKGYIEQRDSTMSAVQFFYSPLPSPDASRPKFAVKPNASLREIHEEYREGFWGRLPDMYGLPDWEELEALKLAVIG